MKVMDVTTDPPFFHSPDWRHLRAQSLLASGLKVRRAREDTWVVRDLDFLRALARCPDDKARIRLSERMPDMAVARHLATADPPRMTWMIQAHLLAGEAPGRITALYGIPPETLTAYEKVFFGVRGWLGTPGVIAARVLGGKADAPLVEQGEEAMLKTVAYRGGPALLDVLLGYSFDPAACARLARLLIDDLVWRQKVRLGTAALGMPIDEKAAGRAGEILENLEKLARFAEAGVEPAFGAFGAILGGGEEEAPASDARVA